MNVADFINGTVKYKQKQGQGLFVITPEGAEILIAVFASFPVVMKMPQFQSGNEGYYEARRFQDEVGDWIAQAINEKLQRETDPKTREQIFEQFTSGIADINPGAKKWILEAMEEYHKQGRYYTPDEIREIQEQAYAEGSNATFDGGLI